VDSVFRAATVYLMLLVIFRISGKRTLAQITTFDLVLSLIISEAIQQAMLNGDNSFTNAFLLVVTLVLVDIGFAQLKMRWPRIDRLLEGAPVVVVENGTICRDRMGHECVDEAEILTSARENHGVERMDQVKYAVVEQNGRITVVPHRSA
jgi:uncharacterized membrane protein YcaP (DUF421 family)